MAPKFRAWDKEGKLWINIASLVFDEEGELWYLSPVMDDFNPVYYENELGKTWEIMQSTGLKDKNGVEIFEGDVLTSNVQPCKMVNPIKDGYGVVRFENGMFKLGAISLVTFISKMEVIGNIYENPELLEQANEN